jgi:hypothetical protein
LVAKPPQKQPFDDASVERYGQTALSRRPKAECDPLACAGAADAGLDQSALSTQAMPGVFALQRLLATLDRRRLSLS